ncbi:MAG: DNA-binding protein [Syntrophaceae bacterium]|nr:DNA-binding protein [Syntrophaceae bacterium]
MRTKRIIGLLVVAFVVLVASVALAQPWKGWRGSGGWGMGNPYQRNYNPATVETISGVVESVNQVTPVKGMSPGIELIVKTDKETIPVHLGPAYYIERLDVKIEKGDKVEAKGSRATFSGKPAIIAGEIRKGDSVLKLRDDAGIPIWSGWRR